MSKDKSVLPPYTPDDGYQAVSNKGEASTPKGLILLKEHTDWESSRHIMFSLECRSPKTSSEDEESPVTIKRIKKRGSESERTKRKNK